MLESPRPVLVAHLFPPERAGLLALLESLRADEWMRRTVCDGWNVKDLVAHLLADDLGLLSRGRDGYRDAEPERDEPLVGFIDRRNGDWVDAARRLSPRVLRDALEWTGHQTALWFASLDPFATGGPVSWAGPDPAPVWLDVARELSERWHHGEQIRDAVGAPSADDPELLGPVLATFAFALPAAFRTIDAPGGTAVVLRVTGPAGGTWSVVRGDGGWGLYSGAADASAATVTLAQDDAWRMYTRVIGPAESERRADTQGERSLARPIFGAVALIA